jgi:hypothetical protein
MDPRATLRRPDPIAVAELMATSRQLIEHASAVVEQATWLRAQTRSSRDRLLATRAAKGRRTPG